MNTEDIFLEAIAILPSLFFLLAIIYAIFWFLGVVKWPTFTRREELLDRFGMVEISRLGGYRLGALALISLVSLYLELLLIRWISSEIRVFAYFKSLVLIASYLGFGLGAYLTRRKIRFANTLLPLMGIVVIVELPWEPLRKLVTNFSSFIGWFSDIHIFGRAYFVGQNAFGLASAILAVFIVILLFGLIAITFIPIGQLVGWYLENSKQGIAAYSINVGASLVGIWLFTLLSFLSSPPIVWFALLGLMLLLYFWILPKMRWLVFLSFIVIIGFFAIGNLKTQWWGEQSWKGADTELTQLQSSKAKTLWSPYQKLTVIPLMKGEEVVRYILNTNDSWYQQILDLSNEAVAKHPELYGDIPVQYFQYNMPYQFYKNPPSVLIAGAGMGNDAAAALRNGAGHVTAVEIDPLIFSEGKKLHFEKPYDSDRVNLHVDDARSFIQNTDETYDLIVFSILDSQTTNSYYTNIRLDNYVYTLEAMQATKDLLKTDGLFVMSFSSERPWFTTHLRDVITQAFGKPPLMVQTNVSFFVIGPGERVNAALAEDPQLRQFVDSHSDIELEQADLITDDWPYLYQQFRGIPLIVWVLSLGLVGVTWLSFYRFKGSTEGIQWHFFFLGAAFTLLEVQIISKIALLFGTTWLVNSIVITTMLLFILLSNLIVYLFPNFPRQVAYIGLFVVMILSYLIPTNNLFYESIVLRGLVATLLYCSPAFFAGLIFISSFKQVGFRAEAFGSNLFGSLVGGLMESFSYLLGIQALVIVAALLYLLSMLTIGKVPSIGRTEQSVISDQV